MRSLFTFLLTIITVSAVITSCNKNDDTPFADIKNYITTKPGKYIIYTLDSTVTVNFGAGFITKSSLIKDSVINSFLDNLNRLSYKIYRYKYDSSARKWNAINTYYFTPTSTSYEYVDENVRYIKLVNPASESRSSWAGNVNATLSPFYNNANFSSWQYYYENVQQPFFVGTQAFANTITVVQHDSNENPIFKPNNFNTYDKGYEVYADSIGLIYKDIMSWQYQISTTVTNCKLIKPKTTGTGFDTVAIDCGANSSNCEGINRDYAAGGTSRVVCDTFRSSYYYDGYGIKMKIVSHN